MLRLLNVLNTQPRYVEPALAARVLALAEQYAEWCVDEVRLLPLMAAARGSPTRLCASVAGRMLGALY